MNSSNFRERLLDWFAKKNNYYCISGEPFPSYFYREDPIKRTFLNFYIFAE